MIAIVHYGLGNIQAFVDIYRRLNVPAVVAQSQSELSHAEKIILPGVGAFDWAMQRLNDSGMRETLDELVLDKKCPVLGICVGMQMMARRSEEGELPGLNWIPGDVKRFDDSAFTQRTHLPHMGWNDVQARSKECLLRDMVDARFYFLHSYYFCPDHSDSVLATTDYNGPFASAIRQGNVFGAQFHPEKSHEWGIRLLKNFAEL